MAKENAVNDEQFSDEEMQRRFEAALRGAREVGHEPMKDIPAKRRKPHPDRPKPNKIEPLLRLLRKNSESLRSSFSLGQEAKRRQIPCHVYPSIEAARSRQGGHVELISFPHSRQILPPDGLTISDHVCENRKIFC
jgi:hypothetical protein